MVDERGAGVAHKDGEHHAFGVARVEEAYGDAEHADEYAVDPLAGFGLCGGDGIGGHEYGTECETAHYELLPAGDCGNAGEVADAADEEGAEDRTRHDLPACHAGPEEDESAEKDGDHRGFTHGTGYGSEELAPDSVAVLGGAVEGEGSSSGEAVDEAFARLVGYPHFTAGHCARVAEEQERPGEEGRVPDVHSGTSEDFFSEDYCKRDCECEHP